MNNFREKAAKLFILYHCMILLPIWGGEMYQEHFSKIENNHRKRKTIILCNLMRTAKSQVHDFLHTN